MRLYSFSIVVAATTAMPAATPNHAARGHCPSAGAWFSNHLGVLD